MIKGTSWENNEGDKVTLGDLLKISKNMPVKKVPVDKLKPMLINWDDEDEISKIEKSDLKYPILIFVDDNNEVISIIDGHHRLTKAINHNLKTIKAKLIPINSLPKKMKRVFGHLMKKSETIEQDISGAQGTYTNMKPAYHFDSGGPGRFGPYQYSESVEQIIEMMKRMKIM